MKYTFTVPVNPQPKKRPRLGRGRHVYTPRETTIYEEHVAAAALAARLPKLTSQLAVTITLLVEPKRGPVADVDNYAKAVLDGMAAFFNDRLVVSLLVTRHQTPKGTGCAHVTIEEMPVVHTVTAKEWKPARAGRRGWDNKA